MRQNQTQLKGKPMQRRSRWLAAGLASALALVCAVCGLVVVALTLTGRLGETSPFTAPALSGLFGSSDPGVRSELVFATTTGTPLPTGTPTATPTPTVTPTITPTPPGSTPVAVEPAAGWSFAGVRIQPDTGLGGLTIYGEAFNDSGAPQRVLGLQSTLYDSQGQVLTKEVIDDYWPLETVPAGGRMPFELTVLGPSQADRVELRIATEPGLPPRTDFELTGVEGAERESDYCVTGRARNLGQPLDSYLMVVAVLYDEDDRVINWGIGYEPADALTGEEELAVSACAERFNRIVARHELRAWGE